jgi:uncharacterized protein YegP (UPF0339 family)
MIYYIYSDTGGYWHWMLMKADGQRVARSGDAYASKAACQAAVDLLRGSGTAAARVRFPPPERRPSSPPSAHPRARSARAGRVVT